MKAIAIVYSIISLSAFAQFRIHSDSGIQGKPYAEIVKDLQALPLQFPKMVKVIKYGESINGKPLVAIRIKAPIKKQEHQRAIFISGAIHGDEYINIVDRLPAWFLNNAKKDKNLRAYLTSGGVLYLVPIVNPDGYDRRSRYNMNRKDLNRDFTVKGARHEAFKERETKLLAEFIQKEVLNHNLKLEVTVDYHCCNGSLLYPWSYKKERMPKEDLRRHTIIGESMKKHIDSRYRHGITGEVLGYYPRGTSKDYYYERYRALAFTFEGRYGVEDRNFEKHTTWWSDVFKFLLTRKL